MTEPDEPPPDSGDVERYEALRRQALDGTESGWRLGLALLQRRGVTAWSRAWRGTARLEPVQPVSDRTSGDDEVIGVLAAMALACLRAG